MELKVNPLIKSAMDNDSSGAVEIQGFIGDVSDNSIRVYKNLDLASYWEIPIVAVCHVEDSDKPDEPAKIFVSRNAKIVEVATRTMDASDLETAQPIPQTRAAISAEQFLKNFLADLKTYENWPPPFPEPPFNPDPCGCSKIKDPDARYDCEKNCRRPVWDYFPWYPW